MKLPIGISNFKELIENGYHFVDKSLFIKEVMDEDPKVIVITRPRRFGKTINLSMLSYFLQMESASENSQLFEGLAIAQDTTFCQRYQQQYPVLFITFKGIKALSFEDAYLSIQSLISDIYHSWEKDLSDVLSAYEKRRYQLLIDKCADLADLKNALKNLTVYVCRKTGKKPVVLIDEYDTPIHSAYTHDYYMPMMDLMRGLLGEALKDNDYLEKAVITGITRVSQESLFSGLNNIKVYSLLREKLGQYFGFTETEVTALLSHFTLLVPQETIKDWYNGYQIGKYTLYNPWSVINCLHENGAIRPYWINTADNALVNQLLSRAGASTKQLFEKLLQGQSISCRINENITFPELDTNTQALWDLLLFTGYLNITHSRPGDDGLIHAEAKVPNKEIMTLYLKMVREWFIQNIEMKQYEAFVNAFMTHDVALIKYYLSSYIKQSGSYFDFNSHAPEQIYHVFILGLVAGLRDSYLIQSNQESGFGRYDVAFIPKNKQQPGILLEFKTTDKVEALADKAQAALDQIKSKEYSAAFIQHGITSVLALGIAFSGKHLEIAAETILF